MAKNKKKKFDFLPLFLFIAGVLIIAYPIFSKWYYRIEANEVISGYERAVDELEVEKINRKLELAHGYNNTLDPSRLADPWTSTEKAGVEEYARMLELNEQLGFIEVPKINEKLLIYAGTSETVLQMGAGHLEGTSLPVGVESTHTVITAHRGLPTKQLFTDLDKMEEGDVFYIHVLNQVLAYEVDNIQVVEPTNFEPVLVVDGQDYATLLTCTPYMINSHRLLVRGHRIPYTPPKDAPILGTNPVDNTFLFYLIIALVVIIIILLILIYIFRKQIRRILNRMRGQEVKVEDKKE